MTGTIELLDQSRLVSLLGRPPEGQMAFTILANVVWKDGHARRSYVKVFPKNRQLCILNELTGYLLGRACRLPLPTRAGLLKLPPGLLYDQEEFQTIAFVVSEVPGETPSSSFNLVDSLTQEKIQAVVELLLEWPDLPGTIAFDDWTANTDRNLGNLVVSGPGRIYLIDHSNLPVRPDWTAADLEPNQEFENKLLEILEATETAALAGKRARDIAISAGEHAVAFESTLEELVQWWDQFLSSDEQRRAALEEFLQLRALEGKNRLSSKLHLLAV